MTNIQEPRNSLPGEAGTIIWRIFGAGERLGAKKSTFNLIDPIVRKYISLPNVDRIIAQLQGWFEEIGGQNQLSPGMHREVERLILEGVREERSDRALWAVAWIPSERSSEIIQSTWCRDTIDSFFDATCDFLRRLSNKDEVLDPSRLTRFSPQESMTAKIPKSAIQRNGLLSTFRHSLTLHYGIHWPVRKLIALIVELRPEKLNLLLECLDHPVLQGWATRHLIESSAGPDHRMALPWIQTDACDALIALSLVHTLETITRLDRDLAEFKRDGARKTRWGTELRPPKDDLNDAAIALISDLTARLKALYPFDCARWTGRLLSYASEGLQANIRGPMPRRIEQLEGNCIAGLAELVHTSSSEQLLTEFKLGLCESSSFTWIRHRAELAVEIHRYAPETASSIARAILADHERTIEDRISNDNLHFDWKSWQDRAWICGIGAALILSDRELDLLAWVKEKCGTLPITAWDAEEDYSMFVTAKAAANHWLHVGLKSVQMRRNLGYATDASEACALATMVWDHCHFAQQHGGGNEDAVVELAGRIAAEFGEPDGTWLLRQARCSAVPARGLWSILDQQRQRRERTGHPEHLWEGDAQVNDEIVRLAARRFGSGMQFGFGTLKWWAMLWIELNASKLAGQTARAILSYPLHLQDRSDQVLLLRLLAFVISEQQELEPDLADFPGRLYGALWPTNHTDDNDRQVRKQIDKMLGRSHSGPGSEHDA